MSESNDTTTISSEGVFHGPYPDTGDPYTPYYRNAFAVEEALTARRITPEVHAALMRNLHLLFTQIHNEHTAKFQGTTSAGGADSDMEDVEWIIPKNPYNPLDE